MSNADRQALYRQAKAFEKQKSLDRAVDAYLRAGAIDDAARVLWHTNQYEKAAKLLLGALGVAPEDVGRLDGARKKRAFQAALCLSRAGDFETAAEVFVGLGELTRAAEELRRAGRRDAAQQVLERGTFDRSVPRRQSVAAASHAGASGTATEAAARRLEESGKLSLAIDAWLELGKKKEAARVAGNAGDHERAAKLFEEAGVYYEAARHWLQADKRAEALSSLQRVPKTDRRYREACVIAIRLASRSGELEFSLENFLDAFIRKDPENDKELRAFYELAQLYHRHGFDENAEELLVVIRDLDPNHANAQRLLDELKEKRSGAEKEFATILEEEVAFERATSESAKRRRRRRQLDELGLPDLPDLPDLPPMEAPQAGTKLMGADPAPKGSASGSVPQAPAASNAAQAPELEDDGQKTVASGVYHDDASATAISSPGAPSRQSGATPATSATAIEEGMVIGDRYRLVDRIGKGGMAVVFRAEDQLLGGEIAIKFFNIQMEDEALIKRFIQEVALARQLTHQNVIRIHDIGVHRGVHYITMELLSGQDLKDIIREEPIPLAQAVRWLIQICDGLNVAHEAGIIHRDMKPQNVFVTDAGQAKIMDFGIAKAQDASTGLTAAGMILGTPDYMSPEQINGFSSVTHMTDLYSVGVMAYEMVTGELPFRANQLAQLLMMHVQRDPVPPRERNPGITPALEKVVLRLMSKNPDDRYQNCASVAAALRKILPSIEAG